MSRACCKWPPDLLLQFSLDGPPWDVRAGRASRAGADVVVFGNGGERIEILGRVSAIEQLRQLPRCAEPVAVDHQLGYLGPVGALLDRLINVAHLQAGDPVLEVGAGPGKATMPLAERGLRVTALEPGPALAAHARRNLAGYPVEVVEARFEDYTGPPAAFAAVVAATAWHWVDPDRRYGRAADALRPRGHLAIWSAQHVFPVNGDPFFTDLQEVYDGIGEPSSDG